MLRGGRFDRHGGPDPLDVGAAHPDGADRVDRSDRAGRGDRAGTAERVEQVEQADRADSTDEADRADGQGPDRAPARPAHDAHGVSHGPAAPSAKHTGSKRTDSKRTESKGSAKYSAWNSALTSTASPGVDPAMPLERTVRENFPVALRILPARHRKALGAVYRFARLVDDIGDEAPPAARGRLLDQVDRDIDLIYAGRVPALPALQAIREVVRGHAVPEDPLRKLVQANRQDQVVLRYETWDQLVRYCSLSADPVGLLVLHVFDSATPERIALSDKICTALQVVEHCQDVSQDFARGRVYLPAEDLKAFGCTDADLVARATPTRLRGAVTRVADRASGLLDEGAPLVRGLDGWAGICVAGYLAGGRAALAALRGGAYDVHARRLRPSRVRTLGEALLVLGGK